jgi:hypothetical protein
VKDFIVRGVEGIDKSAGNAERALQINVCYYQGQGGGLGDKVVQLEYKVYGVLEEKDTVVRAREGIHVGWRKEGD